MLQNIHILAGEIPAMTGELKRDNEALRAFLERLLRGLEQNFDALDAEMERVREIATARCASQ